MDIIAVESTNLFIGSEAAPRQVVRIVLRGSQESAGEPAQVRIEGARVPNRGVGRPRAAGRPRGGPSRDRRGGRRDPGRGRPPRCRGRRRGRPGDPAPALPAHRRGARLADVPGLALPLRPGLVEHPGGLHRDLGRDDPVPGAVPGARPGARQVAPRDGPARPRLQVRPRRARLPQAVLGRLSRGPRLRPAAPGRRPARVRRRHLQRAEHEPDERGIDHPQRDLRHRLPARRPGRRPGHGLAARRVRARPAVPRDHGRRRRDLELVGARAVPRMGSQLGPRPGPDALRRAGGGRPPADAVPDGVRLDRAERAGPADELHGRPLFGRLVDGRRADARGGRGRGPSPVHRARHDGGHQERHAAGRHRLHAAQQVGQRDPARLEQPLRLAQVHDGHPARVLRRRARRAGRHRAARSPRRRAT